MPKFNHMFDFAFTVISEKKDASDVSASMLIAACRKRLATLEAVDGGAEMLEASGLVDTYKVT